MGSGSDESGSITLGETFRLSQKTVPRVKNVERNWMKNRNDWIHRIHPRFVLHNLSVLKNQHNLHFCGKSFSNWYVSLPTSCLIYIYFFLGLQTADIDPEDELDYFFSHDWETSRLLKWLSLLVMFNSHAAAIAMLIAARSSKNKLWSKLWDIQFGKKRFHLLLRFFMGNDQN